MFIHYYVIVIVFFRQSLWINVKLNDLLKHCADLLNKLTDFGSVHSMYDLLNEIEILPTYLRLNVYSLDILNYLLKNNLIS